MQGTLTVTGVSTLRGATTCVSSLNVSGNTALLGNVGIGTSTPNTNAKILNYKLSRTFH